jgi:hypothetical protein
VVETSGVVAGVCRRRCNIVFSFFCPSRGGTRHTTHSPQTMLHHLHQPATRRPGATQALPLPASTASRRRIPARPARAPAPPRPRMPPAAATPPSSAAPSASSTVSGLAPPPSSVLDEDGLPSVRVEGWCGWRRGVRETVAEQTKRAAGRTHAGAALAARPRALSLDTVAPLSCPALSPQQHKNTHSPPWSSRPWSPPSPSAASACTRASMVRVVFLICF